MERQRTVLYLRMRIRQLESSNSKMRNDLNRIEAKSKELQDQIKTATILQLGNGILEKTKYQSENKEGIPEKPITSVFDLRLYTGHEQGLSVGKQREGRSEKPRKMELKRTMTKICENEAEN